MAEISQEALKKIGDKIKKQHLKGKYTYADRCLLSKDKQVVLHTMLVLGAIRADKYVDIIAQVLLDGADPLFRKTAAEALGLMLADRGVYLLVKRLEIEKDKEVADTIRASIDKIHKKQAEAE